MKRIETIIKLNMLLVMVHKHNGYNGELEIKLID